MLNESAMDETNTLEGATDPDEPETTAANASASAPLPDGGLEVISIAKSYDKRAILTDIS